MEPIIQLENNLKDCKIVVYVAEAYDCGCTGTVTVRIEDYDNGKPLDIEVKVTNLTGDLKEVIIDKTPKTGKVHPVKAKLKIGNVETKWFSEAISLCS